VQHWLKVMHRMPSAGTVGDPHRLGAYGEPVMPPAYEPGDMALVYLAGTYRCPAVVEITGEASFDATQTRWGWRTPVRVVAEVPLAEAPTLEEIGVARVSVGRQSRLRLTPDQFERGRRTIDAALSSSVVRPSRPT
jgi:hypothetical protein